MARNVKNELNVEVVGDIVKVKREVVDEFDAQEYLSRITQLDNQKSMGNEQMKALDKDLEIFSSIKEDVQKIRMKEIEKSKKEREEAVKKEKKKLG